MDINVHLTPYCVDVLSCMKRTKRRVSCTSKGKAKWCQLVLSF